MATDQTDEPKVTYLHDGEWARVGNFTIYPREDGTYSIGVSAGVGTYRDFQNETGFANMQAAIDQAAWLSTLSYAELYGSQRAA